MNLVAECCCGECEIELQGAPVRHGICHCSDCKKRTGSAFGISAYFDRSQVVRITGKTRVYAIYNDGHELDQQRYYCSNCGSTLYWYILELAESIGVAGGCFVKTPLGEPTYTSSHGQKCHWVGLPDSLRVMPEDD